MMENLAEKQEHSDQNIKREEVCFELGLIKKETKLMDDINEENILSYDMKLENRQSELIEKEQFDESNQIMKVVLIKSEDEMSHDRNEPVPQASFSVTQSNTMSGCTSNKETTTVINTSPSTSAGNATIQTGADNSNQKTSTRALRPWWNDECKYARHLRRKALRKFNKKPSSEHLEKFKQERAKARRLFRQYRKECWAINVADY